MTRDCLRKLLKISCYPWCGLSWPLLKKKSSEVSNNHCNNDNMSLIIAVCQIWITLSIHGIPAICDFRIHDLRYLVIQFQAQFCKFPAISWFSKKNQKNSKKKIPKFQKKNSQFYKRLISIFCCCLLPQSKY